MSRRSMRALSRPTNWLASTLPWPANSGPYSKLSRNALGNRARKAGQGVLTVRFEMPFAIWCSNCPKETIIGQGVRFNAEKKKIGNYHSTPIYSFRMKHAVCGGWIEIQTDPRNTAYVVTEGATKRDTGEDVLRDGDFQLRSEAEKDRLRNDAFAALEVTIDDRQQAKIDKGRIDELSESKDRDWDDPYEANQRLRKTFRAERKLREKDAVMTENLKDRMSLGIDLLAESEEDRRRAALVDFDEVGSSGESLELKGARARGLFPQEVARTKSEIERKASKKKLQDAITQNTRNAVDPFLTPTSIIGSGPILGLKRKRKDSPGQVNAEDALATSDGRKGAPLVDYDSD